MKMVPALRMQPIKDDHHSQGGQNPQVHKSRNYSSLDRSHMFQSKNSSVTYSIESINAIKKKSK